MPKTELIFFMEDDGSAPVLEWLTQLPRKARAKCQVKMERLAELGHELRRPEADFLRDKIYELRVGLNGVNYRILYFFHKNTACSNTALSNAVAVLAHGIVKEKAVPAKEIALAIERLRKFENNPRAHSYVET